VYHENRVIRIDDEYDLEKPPASRGPPDEVPFVGLNQRKWRLSISSRVLGLLWRYTVPGNVPFVPRYSSKVQPACLRARTNVPSEVSRRGTVRRHDDFLAGTANPVRGARSLPVGRRRAPRERSPV